MSNYGRVEYGVREQNAPREKARRVFVDAGITDLKSSIHVREGVLILRRKSPPNRHKPAHSSCGKVKRSPVVLQHLKILGLLYVHPLRAIGRTLDQGTFSWAIALAAASAILFSLPWMTAVRKGKVESPSPPGLLVPSAFPDSDGAPAAVPDSCPVLRQISGELLRLPLIVLALMSGVFCPA
jgi:hypothetical protein